MAAGTYKTGREVPCAFRSRTCGRDATVSLLISHGKGKWTVSYCDEHHAVVVERMAENPALGVITRTTHLAPVVR